MTSLPLIDIEPLLRTTTSSSSSSSETCTNSKNTINSGDKILESAKQIDDACRKFGFLRIHNYKKYFQSIGRNTDVLNVMFNKSKDFLLNATMEQKNSIYLNKQHRGYFGFNAEHLDDKSANLDHVRTLDVKEGIYFGIDKKEPKHQFQGMNQYPPEVNNTTSENLSWKSCVEQYMSMMMDIGMALLHGIALGLNLQMDYFDNDFSDPMAVMRIIHYPPCAQYVQIVESQKSNTSKTVYQGCGVHTDYGMLTILAQDDVDGLQIQNADGSWMKIKPEPDTLVVNLGDALQMWTNYQYRATPHRVILYDGNDVESASKHRFSIPFFFEPNYHCVVKPLSLSSSNETEATQRNPLEGMKYGDYLAHRLTSTYGSVSYTAQE